MNTLFNVEILSIQVWGEIALALCIMPGLVIAYSGLLRPKTAAGQMIYALMFAAAYWIVGFSFLKFLPVSLVHFIAFSIVSSVCILTSAVFRGTVRMIRPGIHDIPLCVVAGAIFVSIYRSASPLIVPAGADMATHTYTARVIQAADGFPLTHEPFVPITHFGFGPYGLSVLAAVLSNLSGQPVFTSMLLLIPVIYAAFGSVLYLLLTPSFSATPALFTTIYVFLIEKNLTEYITWGGNTTILSLAFITLGICIIQNFFSAGSVRISRIVTVLMVSLLIAASFYTHPLPALVGMTFASIMLPYLFLTKRNAYVSMLGGTLIGTALFLLPFAFSYIPVPVSTQEYIRQRHAELLPFSGSLSPWATLTSIVRGFVHRHSVLFASISLAGYVILATNSFSLWRLISGVLFYLVLLLVNSRYWILPFSSALFPDRILTFLVLPCAVCVAVYFQALYNIGLRFVAHYRVPRPVFAAGVIVLISILIFPILTERSEDIADVSGKFSSITKDDMNMFMWMRKNIPESAVIANNYGDAGLWIPSILGMRIITNDANAQYIHILYLNQLNMHPDYIFVGAKQVYDNPRYVSSELETKDNIETIFRSGKARLFREVLDGSAQY